MERKRVLLTTATNEGDPYDYVAANARGKGRRRMNLTWIQRVSYGLRFLKYNVPGIDILEYPTWREFVERIHSGNYDTVGFSFYSFNIPLVLRMIEYARARGVKTIWGGNYGALTPEIADRFDRVFVGYSERALGEQMGIEVKRLRHPPIVEYLGITGGIKLARVGVLKTTRGCPMGCKFCQTPVSCPKPEPVPMESIKEVLSHYRREGILNIMIVDESFGVLKEHAREVVDLMHEYQLHWYPMIRADTLAANMDEWHAKGLFGVQVGVESFSQESLNGVGKKESVETIREVLERADKKGLFVTGYYLVGFENDTVASVKRDLLAYAELPADIKQVCVMTPFPRTPLWDELDGKYGIFDKDYAHFDAKHLVWKHPHIAPEEMNDVLSWGFDELQKRASLKSTLGKLTRIVHERSLPRQAWDANISFYLSQEYKRVS